MADWNADVRERLPLEGVRPDVALEVIDDLAVQLEEAYDEAVLRGLSEADALAAAHAHVPDWLALGREVARSRRSAESVVDRFERRAGDAAVDGDRRAGLVARVLERWRLATRVHRHRGYFAFATTTLAVAVGVNLIVFTVVNALWLRPMPFPNADRLVAVTDAPMFRINPDHEQWKTFEAIAGQVITTDMWSGYTPRVRLDGAGRDLEVLAVTHGYFRLFDLPVRGRDFSEADDRDGAEPVAIISDRLWAEVFARRSDVVGNVVAATPFPIRIVGVAPAGFSGARRGERADVWIPSSLVQRLTDADAFLPDNPTFMVFARLFPGSSASDSKERMLAGVDERSRAFLANRTIVPLRDVFGTPEAPTVVVREENALRVVAGLAALVLAGGCATLMALVLVHYERRRRDLAVRMAIGASGARVRADLIRELSVLAVTGTLGALVVAALGLRALPALSLSGGVDLGRLDLSIDWRVLGAAIATTMATLAVAAWLPVRRFARASLAHELLAGPSATPSASSHRVRQALLGLHVAATIIVLVAAGLFVRAVAHGFGNGTGFDVDHVAFVTVMLNPTITPGDDVTPEVWQRATRARTSRLSDAIAALPGVEAVAQGAPPITDQAARSILDPTTIAVDEDEYELVIGRMSASPNWMPTLGIPLLSGRELVPADVAARPIPVVVTESMARALWPTRDPVGQTMSGRTGGRGGGSYQVVGISRDFVFGSLSRPAAGTLVTASDGNGNLVRFAVRIASPETLAASVQKIVATLEPEAQSVQVDTGRDLVTRDLGRQRLGAWFFSGFGLTALLLGVGGVFGLVAHLAESRRREFGVRIALGATMAEVVWRGAGAALMPVAVGVAIGLLVASIVARLFAAMLTGLSPLDPPTYVAVGLVMLASAALASLVAAWRLRHLAPTEALRSE